MAPFDVKQYWETRLADDFSLSSVGRLHWGPYYNQWQYRIRRKVFLRSLRAVADDFAAAAVLDIGSGTGFYVDRWEELGAGRITGVDLAGVAVQKLREKYPRHEFYELNIGDSNCRIPNGPFDFVSAMGVMFHIVDDEQYKNALRNLYASLKPGGILIFSDLFLHGQARRFSYLVHRPLTMVEAMIRETGFEQLARRPLFVLMNEPVDSTNPLLKFYWGVMQRIVNRAQWTGFIFGATLYPLESLLVRSLGESPATEIMVCRKPRSD